MIHQLRKKEIKEIKKLYCFYHKRFWCYKKLLTRLKQSYFFENLASTTLVVVGTIAGGLTLNPIVLGVISGAGVILKTSSELKIAKIKFKCVNLHYTTYEKVLADLRTCLRGKKFDAQAFLNEMNVIDSIVIDLCLNIEKYEKDYEMTNKMSSQNSLSQRRNRQVLFHKLLKVLFHKLQVIPAKASSCFTCSSEEISSLSSAYDSQDENLSQELDSDWSEPDDEENDPTWIPQK